MKEKPLTDLEGAVLAEIAKRSVATSYVVARAFAASPSEYWSGSAGAVYPLIKRLSARGYLTAHANADGKRARLDYRLTEAGQVALKDWLLDAKRASGMGFDPLRTRLAHLELVDAAQRRKFLAEVRELSATFAKTSIPPVGPFGAKIHGSWLKARARWLAMLDFIAEEK
jgi:DNA-binding PadR family transcriptional regulator